MTLTFGSVTDRVSRKRYITLNKHTAWHEEAEVVVVGYGGAGAVSAITAHDAGAKVLILEKQLSDTPAQINHTPNTLLSGGGWFWPEDADKVNLYMERLVTAANETLDYERREQISAFISYLHSNMDWAQKTGIIIADDDDITPEQRLSSGAIKVENGRMYRSEHPDLPGSESCCNIRTKPLGKYQGGAAFFKYLTGAVQRRNIQVLWETPAVHLITEGNEVRGVVAVNKGNEVRIKAKKAVILTCGGFEFNEWMKQNYLGAYPVNFTGNPGNTGDGVNMSLEVGAALWHMNKVSWRAVMKFDEFPSAFSTQLHSSSIFVDKLGRRFSNERYKPHAFGYELTNYDCYALTYPKIPFYWIFDEKRRVMAPLASSSGITRPPGESNGDIFYAWSEDNSKEIDKGWIIKGDNIAELAEKIQADPDNNEMMSADVLRSSIEQYNTYCKKGKDADFNKPAEWLKPIDEPPYYAVKLWLGGPNTQGGPMRNLQGQVVGPDKRPIPRLYSAGELGSFYGMLYPVAGGNLAECIAFGRISGGNAALENLWC